MFAALADAETNEVPITSLEMTLRGALGDATIVQATLEELQAVRNFGLYVVELAGRSGCAVIGTVCAAWDVLRPSS